MPVAGYPLFIDGTSRFCLLVHVVEIFASETSRGRCHRDKSRVLLPAQFPSLHVLAAMAALTPRTPASQHAIYPAGLCSAGLAFFQVNAITGFPAIIAVHSDLPLALSAAAVACLGAAAPLTPRKHVTIHRTWAPVAKPTLGEMRAFGAVFVVTASDAATPTFFTVQATTFAALTPVRPYVHLAVHGAFFFLAHSLL